ncbi:hypothetical protein H4S08_001586 [Coemansia sp. RSA 1365]|nr:hypothetical protein H4S08_001586 [Coemansia sp. RSA 1365]
MAVDARQAQGEYKESVDYIRRLCEGKEVEGLPAVHLEGDQNNNSDAITAVNGSSEMNGESRSSRSATQYAPPTSFHFPSSSKAAAGGIVSPRVKTRPVNGVAAVKTGAGTRRQQVNGTALQKGMKSSEPHDVCDACGQSGEFICCEHCPRVFHFLCVEPPMTPDDVRQIDHWFCRECSHQRSRKRKSRAHAKNIFYPLISNMEYSNPRTFSVPEEIRRLFDGVEADVDGSYINVREDRQQRAHLGPSNRDFSRLTDDHNHPIFCYRCGLSALHGLIVRCDYCPLSWHWDCLDPPLSSQPPPHRRWMCPNHADHAMARHHKFRKERVIDQTNAPENARNSGIVDIVDDDPLPWHEICDPKVRYRITSSRIRNEFSKNAHPCRAKRSPSIEKTTYCDSVQQRQQAENFSDKRKSDDGVAFQPVLSVEEWLQSIVAFQQDVARFIMNSSAAQDASGDVCKKRDKFSVLSEVAKQILSPTVAGVEVTADRHTDNVPVPEQSVTQPTLCNSTSDSSLNISEDATAAASEDVQVALSALSELPMSNSEEVADRTRLCDDSKQQPQKQRWRQQLLLEHGLTTGDLAAAFDRVIDGGGTTNLPNTIGDISSDAVKLRAPATDRILAAGIKRRQSQTLPLPRTGKVSNCMAAEPAAKRRRASSSVNERRGLSESDNIASTDCARASRASALLEKLLRAKGADALVGFLLNE